MRHILASENQAALRRVSTAPGLLAFDFDGTLAPFVADPDRAALKTTTRELLEELARLRPCAVVSGRARQDVGARVAGVGFVEVIGNHGMEPSTQGARFIATIDRTRTALAPRIDPMPGVHLEDKLFSLAIHYRHAPERAEARDAILRALADVRGVRVFGGELVINVVPDDAPHKGDALLALVSQMILGATLFVGDDETDEDVFSLDPSAIDLVTVRVGYSQTTKAAYFLEHQDEVDLLLHALIRCAKQ